MPEKLKVPATDIIQWDVRSWSKAIRFWEAQLEGASVQRALELGGREGGLSLWLAAQGIPTVCSDLMDVQRTAEPLHVRYGVRDRITYQDVDASDIPYEDAFDVIVFKSIIGGIGRDGNKAIQAEVFRQIHKALRPGGRLLFAENLIASPLHRYVRRRFVRWGGSWRYLSIAEMQEFLAPFSHVSMHTTGFLGNFGRTETQRDLLARIDGPLAPLIPSRWNYIAYGVAVK